MHVKSNLQVRITGRSGVKIGYTELYNTGFRLIKMIYTSKIFHQYFAMYVTSKLKM